MMLKKRRRVGTSLSLLILILVLSSTVSLKSSFAQYGSFPVSNEASGKNEFSGTYMISIPTAGTHDFISNVSFLGFGLDWGHYFSNMASFGISLRWNRLYQEDDRQTYQADNAALTGKQFKALNVFPIFPRFKYDFEVMKSDWVPYAQLGLGPIYGQKYRTVGNYNFNNFGWQFGMAPEIGIYCRSINNITGAVLSVRYDAGFGTDDFPAYSAISFSIGVRQLL